MDELSTGSEKLSTGIHEIGKQLHFLKASFADNYLHIGALLSTVKKLKLWKEAGLSNFAEYLTDQGFSRTWGYTCVAVWEKFQDRGKGIIPDRLKQILHLELDAPKEQEALEQARELPAGAFRDALRNLSGGKASDDEGCDHEWETRCKRCGRKQ